MLGPSGQALLCDFGYSRIHHNVTRTNTMIQEGGHARYWAPELPDWTELLEWTELSDGTELPGEREQKFRSNEASDIFSFSMILLSIWTRRRPFDEVKSGTRVTTMFKEGKRPGRPKTSLSILSADAETNYWTLIVEMWAQDAKMRPVSAFVREELEKLCGWSAEEESVAREHAPVLRESFTLRPE